MVPEYLILYRLDLEKRELYVMAHERLTEPGVTSRFLDLNRTNFGFGNYKISHVQLLY